MALRDLAADRSWSFAALCAEAERAPRPEQPVAFPQGRGAAFVLAVLRAWRWNQIVCPLEEGQIPPPLDDLPAACAHLKMTSATTGAPRLVAFTGAQLAADADNIVATMGLRPDWPNLGAISLAHSYGFSNLITPLLLHGIPLILAGSSLPEAVRRAAHAAEQLTLPGVPALWRAWHEAGAIPATVRLAMSAGAPLPRTLEHDVFTATGLKLHNFYGSSECGGIAYDATPEPRQDAAGVGQPMQNVHLSQNADGCLEVRSQAVGQTYWPEPADTLRAGCFRTSDLVEFRDGLVYLRGRAGEQIHVAGRKVSPETIERALATHPAIRECLVFGVPAPAAERTEMIVACVAVEPGVSEAALRQHLLARLPAWQVPRAWWLAPDLAANARGKLSRLEWRRRYLERSERNGEVVSR